MADAPTTQPTPPKSRAWTAWRVVAVAVNAIIVLVVIVLAPMLPVWKERNEIRIGVIAPLTGESAKYGEDIQRGYDLAVEEVNEQGGILGKKIDLVYEDSEGRPQKAVSVAQKLIDQAKVPAILGPLWSSSTLAVAPIAERNHVVLLSSGSSSPKVTHAGDYIFRNEVSDEYGARESAKLYYDAGYTRIAIMFVNNAYGIGVDGVTRKEYSALGGEVVASEAFEQDATDLRTQLLKIKQAEPEALLIVSYKEVIYILKQMTELGLKTQILGTSLFQDPEVLEKEANLAEGAIYTYYQTFDIQSVEPAAGEFVTKFRETYGKNPGRYAPLGYDAVKILVAAIERAHTAESEGIKDALYDIQDFPGLTGVTSMDENGDVTKPVILKTVRDGSFVTHND